MTSFKDVVNQCNEAIKNAVTSTMWSGACMSLLQGLLGCRGACWPKTVGADEKWVPAWVSGVTESMVKLSCRGKTYKMGNTFALQIYLALKFLRNTVLQCLEKKISQAFFFI